MKVKYFSLIFLLFLCTHVFALDQWASGATSEGDYPKEGAGYAIGANEPSAQGAWVNNTHWCKNSKSDIGYLFLSFDKRVTPTKIEIYFAGPAGNYGYSEIWIKDVFTNKYTRIDQTATKTINGAIYTFTNLPNEPMDYIKIVGTSGTWGCVDAVRITGTETKANITGGTKSIYVNYIDSQYGDEIADATILKEGNNYYMYFTGMQNIYILRSKDFLHWGKPISAFINDNISTNGKLNWTNSQDSENKKYLELVAPEVMKLNSATYLMSFSAKEKNGETTSDVTVWSAYATSPTGPFGPTNYFGTTPTRMYEPTPIRNQGLTYNSSTIPHSEPYLSGCPYSSCAISMRLDTKYFWDQSELWGGYTYFGDSSKTASGNYNAIVKLDSTNPTLTHSDGESFKLIDSHSIIYDYKTGRQMHMCAAYNKSPLDQGYTPDQLCIAEGTEILKKNNKYYLFYAANYFNSRAYSTFYKMANTLDCLKLGEENNTSCGVKQGILYDGIYGGTDYTYGHGGIFEGPSGELLFSATVMSKSDLLKGANATFWRKTWIVPLQFDSEGVPITMAPTENTTFNVTIPTENCSNSIDDDFDEMIDSSDPDCATSEVCDNIDNDLDGQINEDNVCGHLSAASCAGGFILDPTNGAINIAFSKVGNPSGEICVAEIINATKSGTKSTITTQTKAYGDRGSGGIINYNTLGECFTKYLNSQTSLSVIPYGHTNNAWGNGNTLTFNVGTEVCNNSNDDDCDGQIDENCNTHPICTQYPNERYPDPASINNFRLSWINGSITLTDLLIKIKLWKYC